MYLLLSPDTLAARFSEQAVCRAYTSAAAEALAHTVIITKIHGFKLKIITDYTGLGKIQYILGQRGLSFLIQCIQIK